MNRRRAARRRLGPWLAAGLLSAFPAAAGFDYLALGDSITEGVCDSEVGVCPVNFCNSGTGLNGYPMRLADSLGCTLDGAPPDNLCGSGCCVVSAGKSSEQTPQMVTRFKSITGTYDVVIIMGGTNDVFVGTSNATIQWNIEEMDDEAVSRGIDPVLSSIIHFRDDISSMAIDDTVEDLRDRIESVANSRNRWFADPWAPLCDSAFCFDQNYYQPGGGGGPDPVGHPNGCGYDIMENVFFGVITSAPVPAAPALTGPSGDITDPTPSLDWTASTDATWHQVEIDDGTTWSDLSQLADSCTGSACSRVAPALAAGSHTWRVRGRNPRGFGAWSSLSFELFTAPPAVPTPIAPSGDIFTVPPSVFEWSDESAPVNGADTYDLRILEGGMEIFNGAVSPTCGGGTCTVAPPVGISTGSYAWEVRAGNAAGDSAFSAPLAFDVFPPPPPIQRYPVNHDTFDDTPPLRWAERVGSTEYRVEVRDASLSIVWDSGLVAASSLCAGGDCTISPAVGLAKESHGWRVRAKSVLGESVPTGWKSFTVLDCASFPDVDLPPPASVAGAETHTACGEIGVGESATVTVAAPAGALTLHAGDLITIERLTVETDAELVLMADPE